MVEVPEAGLVSEIATCRKSIVLQSSYEGSPTHSQDSEAGECTAAEARRLALLCYGVQGLGALLYIVVLWIQVYVDTRRRQDVSVDAFSESHRRWRLRTTLLFLIWTSLGGITLPFGIGIVALVGAYMWYLWRTMRGASLFLQGISVGAAGVEAVSGSGGGAP